MNSKIWRVALLVAVDVLIVLFSSLMPLALRFGIFTIDQEAFHLAVRCLPADVIIAVLVLAVFRLYSRVWSYVSIDDMISVFKASLVIEVLFFGYRLLTHVDIPDSYYIFNWIFLFLALVASRISIRLFRRLKRRYMKEADDTRIMIVGAGSAGSILIKEIKSGVQGFKVCCIIDDNPSKKGKYIMGSPIVGDRFDIPQMAEKYRIEEILIAIPSADSTSKKEIISICQRTDRRIKILPSIATTLKSSLGDTIRDLNYEDFLGREAVVMENPELADFISGKTVMVTGGGGTIGSELCRQIIANHPGQLVIVDMYENTTYELQMELTKKYPDENIKVLIASVRDYDRMDAIFSEYKPEVIYHAAAHKHVPLMEYSPNEAIKNNCMGTLNMAKLADKHGVRRFVLISTDKAVRPTNIMGASKRICEMIVQTYSRMSDTEFVAVRFGNVLGSNGSVIPLFLKQIDEGGPVTLTHREITRFFMTVSEAVSLVLKAGLMAKGGEIFVLDMGEPVKIYDLAVNLIRSKGLVPDKDIEIKIVGIRPGEKLYEELLMDEEGLKDTDNDMIYVGQPIITDGEEFLRNLEALIKTAYTNSSEIKSEVKKICDTYKPQFDN